MKILRLDLIAYGPFTNKALQFPAGGANLHIVYGPNEAGKSCALRALSNALYGITLDQKDGFLHPYEDLRIGLTVDAGGGPVGVVRRKGRANSLRRNDGADSVFPAAEWADFFERFDVAKYGQEGAPLHDPCVIAYLIRPGLFTGRHINVMIEVQSELTMGATVADWWGITGRPANALFMGGIDAEGFFALLTERLGRL